MPIEESRIILANEMCWNYFRERNVILLTDETESGKKKVQKFNVILKAKIVEN